MVNLKRGNSGVSTLKDLGQLLTVQPCVQPPVSSTLLLLKGLTEPWSVLQ